ncbi:MAG TPA: hypothetical protein VFX96_05505 [Pyrinomonadaceae bacterium]|nr:hypothetical protein [Pyrinomonadaceae bacterium]
MTRQTANMLAIVLGTLGVLFMIAMAFGVFMSRNYALFAGVACFILAGAVRRMAIN